MYEITIGSIHSLSTNYICGFANTLFLVLIKSSLTKSFLLIRFGNQKGLPFCEHTHIVHTLIHHDDTKEKDLQKKEDFDNDNKHNDNDDDYVDNNETET